MVGKASFLVPIAPNLTPFSFDVVSDSSSFCNKKVAGVAARDCIILSVFSFFCSGESSFASSATAGLLSDSFSFVPDLDVTEPLRDRPDMVRALSSSDESTVDVQDPVSDDAIDTVSEGCREWGILKMPMS